MQPQHTLQVHLLSVLVGVDDGLEVGAEGVEGGDVVDDLALDVEGGGGF